MREFFKDLYVYWTTDNGAPYSRIEYQVNKAGHCLLISYLLVAVAALCGIRIDLLYTTLLVVLAYWSADWWAPFADHKHTSDKPVIHFTAKLLIGLLACALILAQNHPWVLILWFILYLPVLLARF